jgi:glycosyltransferase involved in cell wall biosynthesis
VRLVYLSGTSIPTRAASALHVVKMSNALAELYDVTTSAVAGEQEDIGQYYGFPINFDCRVFSHSTLPGAGYRFALRSALSELGQPPSVFYGRHLNALWFNAQRAKAFAYEAHAMPGTSHARWLLKRLAQHPNCRAIVCITQLLADDLSRILPRSTKLTVLPDAADSPPASYRHLSTDKTSDRSDRPQIGYVGHLYPGKGMEVIHALAKLMPDWDFHIVGGRDEDIQTWRNRGISDNLHFHGFIRHSDLAGYYENFDIALLPLQTQVWTADKQNEISRWTSPLKAFEYMAHGVPIIASDTPALREIFTNRSTATLVESNNVTAWRDAIMELLDDPGHAKAMAESAQALFSTRHTWGHRAAAVKELLN